MSTTTNIEFSIIIKDSDTAERDTALMRSVALLTLILTSHPHPHTLTLTPHPHPHPHPSPLHFTVEFESNNSIAFLDVLVTHEQEKLTTSLYRKPTHTGLYMLWDSSQNRRYKLGLIKTLVIRIYRICSNKEIITKELNLLRVTLTNKGYPPHIIKRGIAEGEILIRTGFHNKKDENNNKKVIFFTIKYYGQECYMRDNNVMV
jgi:hypothetical protein